ncbi:MAG: sensor histidine kinase, partial [Bacteroides sp.]|nr:sensor histidine kinase [Bacteroides sp.]
MTNRKLEIVIHLIGWGMVFALPLFFFNRSSSSGAPWDAYARHIVAPLNLLLVFYINYFLLIPKLLFRKKTREFLVYNIILVLV